jgi:hypothetical protein
MRLYLLLLITWLLAACTTSKVKVPDLPFLEQDTLQQFKVGDRFVLATSTNSCCMYCWLAGDTLQEAVPESPLIRYVETIEDPANPDCAGCSNFYYNIYECIAPGKDSLYYAVIPMGEVGTAADCKEFPAARVDSLHRRKYIIHVIP